jgi:hypothetical protein
MPDGPGAKGLGPARGGNPILGFLDSARGGMRNGCNASSNENAERALDVSAAGSRASTMVLLTGDAQWPGY